MFNWTRKGRLELLEIFDYPYPGIKAYFTSKIGGFSKGDYQGLNFGLHTNDRKEKVLQNRRILAEKLGFDLKDLTCGEQVHGSNVFVVTSADKGKGFSNHQNSIPGVDALVSAEENLPLVSFYADCVPLFFADITQGIIALAHAGWRGTVKKIGRKTVKVMQDRYGCKKKNIRIAVGPCISAANYQVDERVINKFKKNFNKDLWNEFIVDKGCGKYLLDLRQANSFDLQEYGIDENQIRVSNLCTFSDKDMFYSYRRDGKDTGRMISIIYKRKPGML